MSKFKIFNDKYVKKSRSGTVNGMCTIASIIEAVSEIKDMKFYVWTNGECKSHPNGCPVTSIEGMGPQSLVVKFHGPVWSEFNIKSLVEYKMQSMVINRIMSGAPNPYHQGWVLDHVDIKPGTKSWRVTFMPGHKI